MKKYAVLLVGLLLLAMATKADIARDTVSVADFGLKPNTRENATPFLRRALDSCRLKTSAVLVFPKGRYDFWPQHCIERFYPESNTTNKGLKRLAMLIENQNGLTIDGLGSNLVFHDRMQPFTIDRCDSIFIRNLSIDWDIPLTAQGEVDEIGDGFIDIKINTEESPYIIENERLVFVGEGWKSPLGGIMEFDHDSRQVVYNTGDRGAVRHTGDLRAEELDRGLVRLYSNYSRQPKTGNLLVLRHSERDHAGIFITDSRNIRLDDLAIYHCCGLGVLSQYADNLSFRRVDCVPNPSKNRILAGHDDGFHFSNCAGKIEVDDCTFHALMDDPINIHGTTIRVIERRHTNKLRCRFMHAQSIGMVWARPGEKVGFIRSKTMETISTGIVKSYKQVEKDLFDVEFEKPVPIEMTDGDALENLDRTPEAIIRNSRFLSCRARGLLISTPRPVIVENNTFESSGSAILIAGDANFWYESGAVKNVIIRGNKFRSPCLTSMYQFCEAVISICPEIPNPTVKALYHSNISITGNEFHLFDYPVLYAFSVDGITFSGNRLVRSFDFQPFHPRKDGLTFRYCKNVIVKDNMNQGGILGTTVRLEETPENECKIDKNPFTIK